MPPKPIALAERSGSMSLPAPKYYDFTPYYPGSDSYDASLQQEILQLWKDLTSERTVLKYSPEGLLIPNGSKSVMDRLSKIRYLVIMPGTMGTSLLSVHNSCKNNLPLPIPRSGDVEAGPRPDYYWLVDCPQNEDGKPSVETEPFSDIPLKWPWDLGDFGNDTLLPVADRIYAGHHKDLVSEKSRSVKRTFYHDFCGQYFGSALGFLRYLQMTSEGPTYFRSLSDELMGDIKTIGDAPLIVLYPENVYRSIIGLKFPKYDPEHRHYRFFNSQEKLFRAGLKIVLSHEIGHHMFPIIQARNSTKRHPATWSECMANWYVYHFTDAEERILLHLWSQEVPVEYQSYKALLSLGLSHYGHDPSDLLNVIDRNVSASILLDIEKASSFGWALDLNSHLSLYGEYLIDQEAMNRILSIDHKEFVRRQDRILYNLTPGDELLGLMINGYQYHDIFMHFKGLVSRRTIKVGKISDRDYHFIMADNNSWLPVSVGYCRSH